MFFLGLMIPVVDGGLVDTNLAPGDLPPLGLLALRLSNSYAVRTGTAVKEITNVCCRVSFVFPLHLLYKS